MGCQALRPTDNMRTYELAGYDQVQTDCMYVDKCDADGKFSGGQLCPSVKTNLSAGPLNSGQGIIHLSEAVRAKRTPAGPILLFRPEESAINMRKLALKIGMAAPTVEQFVDAVKETTLANKRRVPPVGEGFLYITMSLVMPSALCLATAAPECTFITTVGPVTNYFKEGLVPINLIIEDNSHSAAPGGTASVKTFENYSSVLKGQSIPKEKGYSPIIRLDANHNKYLEGVSSCNIFSVKGNTISTPAIEGTTLPGITRKSIKEVARSKGLKVEERRVSVDELLEADEVFFIGKAGAVSPVGSITYKRNRKEYGNEVGLVAQQLYASLTSFQLDHVEDSMGWAAGTVLLD